MVFNFVKSKIFWLCIHSFPMLRTGFNNVWIVNLCVFFCGGSKFHKLIHKCNHRSYRMYSLVSGFFPSLKCFCHSAMFVFISSLFLLLCLVFHYVFLRQFLHSPFLGHFGCFQFGAIMHKAITYIWVQAFV